MKKLILLLIFTPVFFTQNVAFANSDLDDQKRRLLDRIIATEDDRLRDRLTKIYESLEDKTATESSPKFNEPTPAKAPAAVQLFCQIRPKVIKTSIKTPSNDFERGEALYSGKQATLVSNDEIKDVYLTPSNTSENCKVKIGGKDRKITECSQNSREYTFKWRRMLVTTTARVDRRTGRFATGNYAGSCEKISNKPLL